MSDWNSQIITEFRTHNGHVETAGFGDRLLLLHTVGARSGADRVTPVMGLPASDGWYVAASKAGAPDEPAWAHNLRAHPETHVEVPPAGDSDAGIADVEVVSRELTGDLRDNAWDLFKAAAPGFGEYERKTDRVIAVFHLVRADGVSYEDASPEA